MSSQLIEFYRFSHNESCTEEICHARKYYIEDGKKFCQSGHEQHGFTQVQKDEDDFNSQGVKTRRKRQVEQRVSTTLHGNAANVLFLRCLQLILWKQCHWLISEKGFSPDFETIVRDLWGLRITDLWYNKISQSSYPNDVNQDLFSSQAEVDKRPDTTKTNYPREKSICDNEKLPKLLETLVLCYLGILLMRLPISLGEVLIWANRCEILYLRAIKFIPNHMRMKLPASFHVALELKAPLRGPSLHSKTQELIQFFNFHHGMVFPSLNVPLLTYKHIRSLALPVEIYFAIPRLRDLLGIEFKFPLSKSSNLHLTCYPEVHLMSLIVIATKLSQPFDEIRRDPESDADPSLIKLNWERWYKAMVERVPNDIERGEEINIRETDVWNMNEKSIDQYLSWFQHVWIDDRTPKLSDNILDLFPLPDTEYQQQDNLRLGMQSNKSKDIQDMFFVQEVCPLTNDTSTHVRRPGEMYKRYRRVEELNKHAKAFYELAASNVGIPLEVLVKVVFQLETKLDSWISAEKKEDISEI